MFSRALIPSPSPSLSFFVVDLYTFVRVRNKYSDRMIIVYVIIFFLRAGAIFYVYGNSYDDLLRISKYLFFLHQTIIFSIQMKHNGKIVIHQMTFLRQILVVFHVNLFI